MNAKLTARETQVRFVRFLVVGGGSAAVQLLILWALKSRWPESVVFSFSWIASTSAHYLFNRFWALPSGRRDTGRQFGEYLATVALSYGMNFAAFKFCRAIMGLNVYWSAFLAIPPSTVLVFLLLNFRVFRAKSS
jgi:putative flippase GtrA